ncbi:hypothetical protein VB715_21270 [Crocosphaera sp. UHCC 0190]|uniref:hypothetical protein n=1 Tax=Crocosphaera sp. UHCC 0190 TaxID=3110246 RepID=UPI002B1F49FC|nr:hypothetical protein [Crocosphaera sp. UHCC 0190]MEA5512307.1 hypothetical protein [Crocosphaera sp. UHCC 0190]
MTSNLDGIKAALEHKKQRLLKQQLVEKVKSCQVKADSLSPKDLASVAISQIFYSEDRLSLARSLQQQLEKQLEDINNGDLSSIEEILTCQLNVLNVMFMDYSIKFNALIQDGLLVQESTSDQVEKLSQLVIKLQNQSTKTARTLTDLKKPRQTTFIKKYVNQQLNQLVTDGKIPSSHTNISLSENSSCDLSSSLGELKNASMDCINQKTAKGVNQAMETLES